MQALLKTPYGLFLFTLLLSGIELFIWFYLGEQGYLAHLISSDQSYVSLLIIAIYSLTTFWFLTACLTTSIQYIDVINNKNAYRHLALRLYFNQLTEQLASGNNNSSLLEVLDTRLRSVYAFGFIVADLMLKLGILGTVIGFIIMLGSLSNLNSVDITVMQTLLVEMSSGMKVALFTTLTGLLAGIMLNIKFNLLDWAVDHLINDIKEHSLSFDPTS